MSGASYSMYGMPSKIIFCSTLFQLHTHRRTKIVSFSKIVYIAYPIISYSKASHSNAVLVEIMLETLAYHDEIKVLKPYQPQKHQHISLYRTAKMSNDKNPTPMIIEYRSVYAMEFLPDSVAPKKPGLKDKKKLGRNEV